MTRREGGIGGDPRRGGDRGGRGLPRLLFLLILCSFLRPCSSYDVDLAHTLVDYAAAAYFCRTPACSNWTCTACAKHPNAQAVRIHDDGHNGNGLVALDPDLGVIVVSFAGTDTRSIPNWIDDINTILTKYPDPNCDSCSVHLGFWETYEAIRDQFMNAFNAARSKAPDAKVWVTGHSLGGALAVHAVLDLLAQEVEVEKLVTFGQPRVGNPQFAAFCADVFVAWSVEHYRLTHARDPVPHLPPMVFGFHHQPLEVWYPGDEEKGFDVCDGSGEDKECSNRYHVYPSIADHMVYLDTDFGTAEVLALAITAAAEGRPLRPNNVTMFTGTKGEEEEVVMATMKGTTLLRGYVAQE